MSQISNRNAKNLIEEIMNHIKDGIIIYFDSWYAHKTNKLEKGGFKRFKVNHKYDFVDPDTSTHKQTVERIWE